MHLFNLTRQRCWQQRQVIWGEMVGQPDSEGVG
ncbi:Uncharacterised protein [Vibrio cholerae]|nr:Uncharacterised protein [Vibrio cholerae]CSI34803.1 Uncharacterised protein [Vibrio cholerae]